MGKKLVCDNFADAFAFRAAITSRPNNHSGEDKSKTADFDFAGMPYEAAYKALTDSIPEAADKLKRELTRFKAAKSGTLTQRRPINYYNGHSPNVPAAIIGLPKSMRKVIKSPTKTKTITLFYNSSANCNITAETLEKCGAAVLQLVYWLEMNGYRVKLLLNPYLAEHTRETACCNILLKDFRQPLDILKLSFSLTSVSMFRRLGFRWIETAPGAKDNWRSGYGHQIMNKREALETIGKSGQDTRNAYFIMVSDCTSADFDAVKLAANLGIKVGES